MTRFSFATPTTTEELQSALRQAKEPVFVQGGGTMLVPFITHGTVRPASVINLSKMRLTGVYDQGEALVVEAGVTYSDILKGRNLSPVARLLKEVARGITGGPQIRNRGTLVGSLAFGNPASDMPSVLAALGGGLQVVTKEGTQHIEWRELYQHRSIPVRQSVGAAVAAVLPSSGVVACSHLKLKVAQSSWPIITATSVVYDSENISIGLSGLRWDPVVLQIEMKDLSRGDKLKLLQDKVRNHLSGQVDLYGDVLADSRYRQDVSAVIAMRSAMQARTRYLTTKEA